ncbi:MAG: GPW/gp25 family protein [Chloroflexota bacterium]|nr:GPW/gp25 family protein [Chloroflexota bacterium]
MLLDAKKYIGTGLSFPLSTDARGQITMSTGSQDIEQSIRIIISTRPGERVMRPTFGCRAYELIFEPRSSTTISLLQEYVYEALRIWEPRINIIQVDVTADDSDDGALVAKIEYEIKATHDIRSIVYPFFIEDEQEIV